MNETIAAIATPPGTGAIALIRISGPEAIALADQIFQGKTRPSQMDSRRAYFGKVVEAGQAIDEVLLTIFRAPKSYTGEDIVEVSGHGGAAITAHLLEVILKAGSRLARPGEFTQRAYLHGKMDLTQAEAVMDLITAQTRRGQQIALEQRSGRLGQEMGKVKKELLAVVAHVEAFFDFPEEDIAPEEGERLRVRIMACQAHLEKILATADEGRLLREGFSLALCGAPNAGKSSLLNRLLRMERAIVSPIPGTTRDTIEEGVSLGGFPFRLIDTAGMRETEDLVEHEGVLRARQSAERAQCCLHVIDATMPQEPLQAIAPGEIVVLNKSDLIADAPALQKSYPGALIISCATGDGIEALVATIVKRVTHQKEMLTEAEPSSLAINARHQACLTRALGCLKVALSLQATQAPLELLSNELHASLQAIAEVTGAVGSEEILGEIFSTFCIGK